jgi:hypothetical protein
LQHVLHFLELFAADFASRISRFNTSVGDSLGSVRALSALLIRCLNVSTTSATIAPQNGTIESHPTGHIKPIGFCDVGVG